MRFYITLAFCIAYISLYAQVPVTSGLRLHLDAALGFNANGAAQATWIDQSSSGNNMISGFGSREPVYVANAAGWGFPGIQFDAVDDYMVNQVLNNTFNNTEATLFFVKIGNNYRATAGGGTSAPGYKTLISIADDSTILNEFGLFSDWALHHSYGSQYAYKNHQCFDSLPNNKPVVFAAALGVTYPDIEYYLNGSVSTMPIGTIGTPFSYTNVNRRITLCSRFHDNVKTNNIIQPYDCYVLEVLAYNRKLSTAEIKQVNDYLLGKYYLPTTVNVRGDTICSGEQAYLTYTDPSAGSTIAVTYTDGTNNYTKTVSNGVPFALTPSPTTTKTYTFTGSADYIICSGTQGVVTGSATVLVLPQPPATAGNDTIACTGDSVILTANGGVSYQWYSDYSIANANNQSILVNVDKKRQYLVVVTGTNGCKDTAGVSVDVRPLPVFGVSPQNAGVCKGKTVTITAKGGTKYYWEPSTGLSSNNMASVTFNGDESTNYSVTITDTVCNISDTLPVNINVRQLPNIVALKSNDLTCNKGSAQLKAMGALSYKWTPDIYIDNILTDTPYVSPNTKMEYTVIGTDSFGCTNSAKIVVDVIADGGVFYMMPDAFTPNGDGNNDCYKIRASFTPSFFELQIYNRWGNRVFNTTNINDCWNGNLNGKPAEVGTYYYFIRYKTPVCGETFKKGSIHLLR